MKKSELRSLYKSKRNQLSEVEIQECSLKILENLKKMPIWEKSVFHIFVPIVQNYEINTFPIIESLLNHDKIVLVPKVVGKKMISCRIEKGTEWTTGKFGVPEPTDCIEFDNSQIEVILQPMLICDRLGNRIGYGGGYYDRFLSEFQVQPLKIGLNFFPPIPKIQEVEPTDIPLDYCVTGDEIVSFSAF
ncbi:5-formyltetrahydrofolate cyclo-ligase [Moheibacter sp.]|uniref:5-formyltetrahydrofolate cyclo-ligase n=1 Tax=Moheibacter sp. TaxID=1965316 RepID=UPI003C78D7F8